MLRSGRGLSTSHGVACIQVLRFLELLTLELLEAGTTCRLAPASEAAGVFSDTDRWRRSLISLGIPVSKTWPPRGVKLGSLMARAA